MSHPAIVYHSGGYIDEVALQFVIGHSSPVDAVIRLASCDSLCVISYPNE